MTGPHVPNGRTLSDLVKTLVRTLVTKVAAGARRQPSAPAAREHGR
jgi:hypothetical protein